MGYENLTPALERIKIRKIYEVKTPAADTPGVRVLARWNNQAAAPAPGARHRSRTGW